MVAIVLVVVVLVVLGAAYGLYSRRGSEISQHPRSGDHAEAPGVGEGTSRQVNDGEGENKDVISTRGTK